MNQIPNLTGYPVEVAEKRLKTMGLQMVIIETMGKNTVKTEDARVIRQNVLANQIELIISYF
ncbi:PASTA domain-containing protein [Alkaliphilus crotonatoxidans]